MESNPCPLPFPCPRLIGFSSQLRGAYRIHCALSVGESRPALTTRPVSSRAPEKATLVSGRAPAKGATQLTAAAPAGKFDVSLLLYFVVIPFWQPLVASTLASLATRLARAASFAAVQSSR